MHGVDPSSTWRLGLGKKPDWLWQPQRHVALGFVRGVGAAWLTQALPSAKGPSGLIAREGSPSTTWLDPSTPNLGLG